VNVEESACSIEGSIGSQASTETFGNRRLRGLELLFLIIILTRNTFEAVQVRLLKA
jgi:hypothetical protein